MTLSPPLVSVSATVRRRARDARARAMGARVPAIAPRTAQAAEASSFGCRARCLVTRCTLAAATRESYRLARETTVGGGRHGSSFVRRRRTANPERLRSRRTRKTFASRQTNRLADVARVCRLRRQLLLELLAQLFLPLRQLLTERLRI